jgi:hypothetical protein
MRTFYIFVIGGIILVLMLLFFPTVNKMVGSVNVGGFLPLLAAATTFLPYAFIGLAIYGIFKLTKR